MLLTRRFILGLWATTVATVVLGDCGQDCGYEPEYPTLAEMHFNIDNCNLLDSPLMFMCREEDPNSCEGLWKGTSFSGSNDDNVCNGKFEVLYGKGFNNSYFNSHSISVADANTCSGNYTWDFHYKYGGDRSGAFKNLKVLCNNNEIFALLWEEPSWSRSYVLYYQSSITHEDINQKKGLSKYVPEVSGDHCTNMFDLMAAVRLYLKSSPSNFDTLPSACGTDYGKENNKNNNKNNNNEPKDKESSSSNTGVIIGAAAGGVACLIMIIIVALYCGRRRKRHLTDAAALPVVTPDQVLPVEQKFPTANAPGETATIAMVPEVNEQPFPIASVTEEKEVLPDGRIKVTKISTDVTGAKNVEETVYDGPV